MKIVFAGTPEFSVPTLKMLCSKGYDVDLVITQKDKRRGRGKKLQYTPVKKVALDLGLEVFQPKNINSEESINKLKEIEPDVLIVIAYGQILRKELLELPKRGCINIHASLLPKYRGAAPINWSIINGEKETGITIMEMEEGLDTGDMIHKKKVEITPDMTAEELHDKLSRLGGETLLEVLDDILNGSYSKKSQDDSLSSYAPMLNKNTGRINWNSSSVDIYNLVRGVIPWPGAFTTYNGVNLKVHDLTIGKTNMKGEPGQIVKVSEEGLLIKTKDGTINITMLQFPNKRKMHVKDFILGNKIEEGVVLK